MNRYKRVTFLFVLLTIFYASHGNNEQLSSLVNCTNKNEENNVMQAAVINEYGGSNVLEITNRPIPSFNNKQVLIKTAAAGVNPIDYKIRKGMLRYFIPFKFPGILGYDICGEIVGIGKKVTKFKLGDWVVAYSNHLGGYAEYIVLDEKHLVKKPINLTTNEAAAVPLASLTALQALRNHGNIQPHSEVMIIGATGGVGVFAVQLAKSLGAKVTAVCSTSGVNLMRNFEIDYIVDYQQTKLFTNNKKYAIIFDATGKYDFNIAKKYLTEYGTYISTLPSKSTWMSLITNFFTNKKCYFIRMSNNTNDLQFIIQQLEQKKIKVIIDTVYPLRHVIKAHEHSENGHARGKIILTMDS